MPDVAAALAALPHAPPMLAIVDRVAYEDQGSTWSLRVGHDHPLLRGGVFPALCGVELVAQAAAAHAAVAGASGAGGVLLRVRSVELDAAHVPIGELLHATVTRTDGTDGATASFSAVLTCGGRRLLSASLLVRMFDSR